MKKIKSFNRNKNRRHSQAVDGDQYLRLYLDQVVTHLDNVIDKINEIVDWINDKEKVQIDNIRQISRLIDEVSKEKI